MRKNTPCIFLFFVTIACTVGCGGSDKQSDSTMREKVERHILENGISDDEIEDLLADIEATRAAQNRLGSDAAAIDVQVYGAEDGEAGNIWVRVDTQQSTDNRIIGEVIEVPDSWTIWQPGQPMVIRDFSEILDWRKVETADGSEESPDSSGSVSDPASSERDGSTKSQAKKSIPPSSGGHASREMFVDLYDSMRGFFDADIMDVIPGHSYRAPGVYSENYGVRTRDFESLEEIGKKLDSHLRDFADTYSAEYSVLTFEPRDACVFQIRYEADFIYIVADSIPKRNTG